MEAVVIFGIVIAVVLVLAALYQVMLELGR